MNDDQVKGRVQQVKGKAKEEAGKATDDTSMRVKSVAEQMTGKTQAAYGDVKNDLKGDATSDR